MYSWMFFRMMSEKELAMERLLNRTPLQVTVKDTNTEKGRGVFCSTKITKGTFVCEYETDEVYPRVELKRRREEYDKNGESSYVVEAKVEEKWLCFDATRRYSGVGRYMNHGRPRIANANSTHPCS